MRRIVKQLLKLLMVILISSVVCYFLRFHELFPTIFGVTSLSTLVGVFSGIVAIVIFAHTRLKEIRQQVNNFLNDGNKKEIQNILLHVDNLNKETQENSFLCIFGSLLIFILTIIKDALPSSIPFGRYLVDISGATHAIIFGISVSVLLSVIDLLIAYTRLLAISSYAPPQ